MAILQDISEALQRGDVNAIRQGVQTALDEGLEPRQILNEGLLDGMAIIGGKFKNNEVFVPEVLIAARAMNSAMEILKPKLVETGVEPIGKVVLGTVKGDLHDIGKNLVKMMLEGTGFEVHDLGVDVPAEKYVEACKEVKPQIIGMSALLTTTMGEMKNVIQAFNEAGIRDDVIMMIGGAPVTQKFSDDIGADIYGKDAAEAATLAKERIVG